MNDLEEKDNDNEEHRGFFVFSLIVVVLNILFLVLNFSIICNILPTKGLDFDYLGLLVGITSILVTILIGWQIFNNMSFEKNAKRIVFKSRNELNSIIKDTADKTSTDINDTMEVAIATSLYLLGCSEYNQRQNNFALHLSLDSMLHCSRIKNMNKDFREETFEGLKKLLKGILDEIDENRTFSETKINEYLKSAEDLNLNEIKEKISLKCKPGNSDECDIYDTSKNTRLQGEQLDGPVHTNNINSDSDSNIINDISEDE